MAARSGKKEVKPTTTRVKKASPKAATKAATQAKTKAVPLKKKVMKKEKSTETEAPVSTSKKSSKKDGTDDRHAALKQILLAKREALIKEIKHQLGQSVTEEEQRRLEAAMDSGDQALVDLEREMGITFKRCGTESGS